ncbi:MAG: hypothetical protein ACYCXH_11860 [Bellilinea sp.]
MRPWRSEPVEERLVHCTRRQPVNSDCRAAARLKRTSMGILSGIGADGSWRRLVLSAASQPNLRNLTAATILLASGG